MECVDKNEAEKPTQIAVLGALAEFHRDPLPYDLAALVALVAEINPDLLCLDISPEQWQRQDFSSLPADDAAGNGRWLAWCAHWLDASTAGLDASQRPRPRCYQSGLAA